MGILEDWFDRFKNNSYGRELQVLQDDSKFLEALEESGVADWEGYQEARDLYNAKLHEELLIESSITKGGHKWEN